jgi:DNA polymerase III subunit epsilon
MRMTDLMRGYLVLDTETNKLPIYKKADGMPHEADADDQPRMAEFAMILTGPDWKFEREYQQYVTPDGWVMHPDATRVNGLTTEFLQANGKPVHLALDAYTAAIKEGRVVVSHNAQFDCKILRGELRRAGMPDLFWETKNVCTMRSAQKNIRGIVKMNGKGGAPRLIDLANHLGVWDGKEQHKALEDAWQLLPIAQIMHREGLLFEPKVHEAAKHPSRQEA